MQAASGSQRGYAQRRSPGADPGPPPSVRPSSPGTAMQPRSSTASSRPGQTSGGSRRSNREVRSPAVMIKPRARRLWRRAFDLRRRQISQTNLVDRSQGSGGSASMPLSQIEKSVTHLLVATKQLLETLTQWSRGQATDSQVSDVYVRLGYEFNMACRAFTAINVDTSDLGNVPDSLRHILEATLSQEASSESLEKYLPRIRDIIINLLHGLKRKQQRLRQKQQGRDRDGNPLPERTTSVSTVGSGTSGLTNLLEEGLENGYRPESQRGEPPQQANINSSPSRRFNAQRDQSRGSATSEQSSLSSTTMQSIPVMPPYPAEDTTIPSVSSTGEFNIEAFPPPPPPPPDKQSSALAALQKGGDLERRASRRYSQYQISKHLGGAANAVPMLPSQNTPIPNRGRKEARESLRAVQSRESVRHSRNLSTHSRAGGFDASPARIPSRVSEESASEPSASPAPAQSPAVQSPEDQFAPSATIRGPLQEPISFTDESNRAEPEPKKKEKTKVDEGHALPQPPDPKSTESYFQVSPPPTPTKDLTLFLQYKSKVKKILLPEGRDELSIGRLQLAFIEKFSWNTQQNGADLPEIYIQDPVSGVRHELEDLSDVKDRTVLVLNVEALDEVKRHIDDGMSALTKIVREVKQHVDDQGTTLQRVSDRQQETASELARLATAQPMTPAIADGSKLVAGPGRKLGAGHLGELQGLKRDLAILRQTYSSFQSEIQNSMSSIRTKAANVKIVAAKAAIPDIEGDAGYSYVTSGRKQLNTDSDRLVGKVDDLQDLVEDLRKDVVHRGVRPLPRQLEGVAKDITGLTKELKRMEDYMSQEKPVWTKIWEKELEDVCQGRDELRLMEDLLVDLRDDLEKATETFTLVEQATKEQMKDNGTGASAGTARQFAKGLNSLGNSANQSAAKEDVLGEVRALQPNHEDRLEAIERAEKLRQKELESRRGNALQREISNFVEEGKLKKSGGFEEVERARKAKDDKIRREVWERQNGIIPEDPVGEETQAEADEEAAEATEAAAPPDADEATTTTTDET
ncbi:Bud site selection protein 6 [Tolypocladium paradoxum]|uniref:Bud site selection protein 6 n=1 Tax=Tolypocladium paradoxum TaxID=94208 RepID=A0A2S4KZU4_9HYPO|nr:Bud site selection protein 6 [Tolypocladium paradoxum]